MQFIDDIAGRDAGFGFDAEQSAWQTEKSSAQMSRAPNALAAWLPKRRKGKGIKQVVFDRTGARYHGKVKALADAAREAGLQF